MERRKVKMPTPEEDAAITAAALADPDAQPMTDEELARLKPMRGRPKGSGTKQLITLRLDADLIEHYRSGGEGWQTRMNDDLRKAAERGRRRAARVGRSA